MMDSKLLGGILLIVGTAIGAGMLALPLATAQVGFFGSVILLFGCWLVMTAAAFCILEANLWLPQNSNLNSMAKATIGPLGQILSWASFLLLLYSLLCAYIAGGSDLFHNLLAASGIIIPEWVAVILFTTIFGVVVYLGMRCVDYVNRGLMLIKFTAYFLLVICIAPFLDPAKLAMGEMHHITSTAAIMVTITSFGYAAIVPSLRIYFEGDVRKLKKAIVIGSLIPLLCYIAWDAAIMGVIPVQGERGLITILNSQNSTSLLVNTLTATANNGFITLFTKLFTSVAVLTSFLGVAICLTDFWADGLQMEKKGVDSVIIHAITFLPPLFIVLFFSHNVFVKALEYAGVDCVVLLMFIPAWMVWNGRYRRHIAKGFRVMGGRWTLVTIMLLSVALIIY